MHLPPDPMTSIFPGHREPAALYILLNRSRDITNPVVGDHLADALVQCAFGYIQQALSFLREAAYPGGKCRVSYKSIAYHPAVYRNDIPFLQLALARNTMDQLVVD